MRHESQPEIEFAEFLDRWGAQWRYEPRWPGDHPDRAVFRVWLPTFHRGRWHLGRVFYVRFGCPVLNEAPTEREAPTYTAAPWMEGNSLLGYVFYNREGRVEWRAHTRAIGRAGA